MFWWQADTLRVTAVMMAEHALRELFFVVFLSLSHRLEPLFPQPSIVVSYLKVTI